MANGRTLRTNATAGHVQTSHKAEIVWRSAAIRRPATIWQHGPAAIQWKFRLATFWRPSQRPAAVWRATAIRRATTVWRPAAIRWKQSVRTQLLTVMGGI